MNEGIVFDIKKYAIHDGPGIRTTVFFKGCPLNCHWCHNPESQKMATEIIFYQDRCLKDCTECIESCTKSAVIKNRKIRFDLDKCILCGECEKVCPTDAVFLVGKNTGVNGLLDEVEKDFVLFDESSGGLTISGGEPLMQPVFLKRVLEGAKKRFLKTVVDTSGFGEWEALQSISSLVDLFLYDLKIMDDEMHIHYTGQSNQKILKNLQKLSMIHNKIEVRFPVIPRITDSDNNVDQMIEFLKRQVKGIKKVVLLKYHNLGYSKNKRLGKVSRMNNISYTPGSLENRVNLIKDRFKKNNFLVSVGG